MNEVGGDMLIGRTKKYVCRKCGYEGETHFNILSTECMRCKHGYVKWVKE